MRFREEFRRNQKHQQRDFQEILDTQRNTISHYELMCRVILKKVSKKDKEFTIESKGKGLSLSRFSWYLAIVKIIKIGRLKGQKKIMI